MDSLLSRAQRALVRHRQAVSTVVMPSADEILGMPLDAFAESGLVLQVTVMWWPAPLWFVGTPTDAEALSREGYPRATIWTAEELRDILQAAPDHATLRTLATAKHLFDGDISLSSLRSQSDTVSLLSPSTHACMSEREEQGGRSQAGGERSEKCEGSSRGPSGRSPARRGASRAMVQALKKRGA